MSDTHPSEWLDWHIDTRVEGRTGPVLRYWDNGELAGQVPLTPGEMASIRRKYDQKIVAEPAAEDAED